MKLVKTSISFLFIVALSTASVSAQESDGASKHHPFLSDRFNIGLGVYRPSKENSIGADIGSGLGGSLDSDESQSTGLANFRWRFTKNWSFQGTYWNTDSEATATLTEDFEWNNEVLQAGSSVTSGVDTSIARLFIGRSFFRRPSTDWGVGAGIHWMEVDLFLEGNFLVAGVPDVRRREEVSASVPLPNLGIWYMYSWSPKWVVITRLDWLDVTIEEISGSLYDASVGLNYQMSDHFGIGLAVNYFKLDVSVDSKADNTSVGFVNEQLGPRLNITWNW